jgi:hypothetical protein
MILQNVVNGMDFSYIHKMYSNSDVWFTIFCILRDSYEDKRRKETHNTFYINKWESPDKESSRMLEAEESGALSQLNLILELESEG